MARLSSSTSTTTPPAGCDADAPEACDDGDPCTDDLCSAAACVNTSADGIRAVTCRLEAIDAAFRGAAPEDVGGPAAQAKLSARIAAVQRIVRDAGDPSTPRARGPLLRAVRQLKSFGAVVARSGRRGKIHADVAGPVGEHTTRAVSELLALLRRS